MSGYTSHLLMRSGAFYERAAPLHPGVALSLTRYLHFSSVWLSVGSKQLLRCTASF